MSINSSNKRPTLDRSASLSNPSDKRPILNRSVSFTSPRMQNIKKTADASSEIQMRRTHSQKNIDSKISSTPEASGDFARLGNSMIEVYKLGRSNEKEKNDNKRFRRFIEHGSRNIENISIKNEKTTKETVTQNISEDLEEGEISPEEDVCFKKRKMIQEGKQEAIRQDISEDLEEGEISPEKGILEKLKMIQSISHEQKDAMLDVLSATGAIQNKDIETLREYLHETPDIQKAYIRNDGSIHIEGYDAMKKTFKTLFGE